MIAARTSLWSGPALSQKCDAWLTVIGLLHFTAQYETDYSKYLDQPEPTKLEKDDKANYHRSYRFDRPVQLGQGVTATFRTVMEQRGLKSLPGTRTWWEPDAQPARSSGAHRSHRPYHANQA